MKGAWFVCIILLMIKVSVAQDACPEFSRLMTEADEFAAHKDYRKALNKYNSAKTCSPTQRAKVDEKVNQLFEKIQAESKRAQAAEVRNQFLYDSLHLMVTKERNEEIQKARTDSGTFVKDNKDWLDSFPAEVKGRLVKDFLSLKKTNRQPDSDSLVSAFKQLNLANTLIKAYQDYANKNERTLKAMKWEERNTDSIRFYGLAYLEYYYYYALAILENGSSLFPSSVRSTYVTQISAAENSLRQVRTAATSGYHIPDTVIGLPYGHWLYNRCANNKDFVIAYLDTRDYNKLQLHYVNYSLPNFVPTVDSSVVLADSGKVYNVLAASANFKNTVGRALRYTLKKNRAELKDTSYVVPNAMRLFDSTGKIITQFDQDLDTTYYFSPDGKLVVTWKGKQLVLYDISLQKRVPLTDNTSVRAMSISTDSRTIAYYNPDTNTIYFSGTDGHPLFRIALAPLGLTDLQDLEFTGNDQFLRLNAPDGILLLNIPERKILCSFPTQRVRDIVVSPNGKDILLSCNVRYYTGSRTYIGYLAVIIDQNLQIKGKLLGEVPSFFFTPDGRYVIGYDRRTLARWTLDTINSAARINQSCISTDELIDYNYLPYSKYASISDASQIERGAYNLTMALAASEKDTLVRGLYYRESKTLYERLAYGNAKNIPAQRTPFFYDWLNWIEQRLGNKNFNAQFSRQQLGTELFDKMVNSPDSVYPMQLYYAANSHRIFGRLYDSLSYYNPSYLDLIREEVGLRQRVLLKDPDNMDNINYLNEAYLKFSSVCNIMGANLTTNRQYNDRLTLFRTEEEYLSNRQQLFYDTLGARKRAYVNALTQLATSFICVYANRSSEYKTALDSAFYYAEKGLQLTSDQNDAASLLMVKAFVYLLKDEVEKAIDICRMTREHYPEINKETMLQKVEFLKKNIPGSTANIQRMEEYIKQ